MAIMEIKNVRKEFGGIVAVNDVSISVNEGEILGVIGPNGSGKTTLINLISGVYPLTSGDIYYKGELINDLAPFERARKGIARTFQIVKPLKNLTVKDNIMTAALFGRTDMTTTEEVLQCMSSKYAQIAYAETTEITQMVGLVGKEDTVARELTLPNLKKLEVARSLAMNPQLLLLDEVMAGLNLKEVQETMDLIKQVNSTGVTIIMIEHIMKVIMGISDNVVVINRGTVICNDKPEEVACNPEVICAYLGDRFEQNTTKEQED